MPTERFNLLRQKYLSEFSQKPTHDLLNQLDSEDLLHYLQSRKMLREEASAGALAPLMHETAARKARQELENVKQGGSPEAIAKLHSETAAHEGMQLPMRPDGVLDVPTALKNIQTAIQSKEQRDLDRQLLLNAHEQTTTTVEPSGRETVTGQMVTKQGTPVSPERTVSTKDVNAPKAIDELVSQKDKKNHERGLDVSIGALRTAKNVLSNPNPSNAEDGVLIDAFLKVANPSAVIRPSMIEFVNKQSPLADQLRKKWDQYLSNPSHDQLPSGAILTENDRRQMAKAFQSFNQAISEDSRDHYSFLKRRAEKQNLGNDLDEIFSDEEMNVIKGKNFVDLPNRAKPGTMVTTAAPTAAAAPVAPAAPAAQPTAQPAAAPAAPAPQAGAQGATPAAAGEKLTQQIPTVNSPDEAPEDAQFYFSPDGRKFVNRKYKPPVATP
jgi:hypothetical protein